MKYYINSFIHTTDKAITIPESSSGYSSIYIQNIIPDNAYIIAVAFRNVSTYADVISISGYGKEKDLRVTTVSKVAFPEITALAVITYII